MFLFLISEETQFVIMLLGYWEDGLPISDLLSAYSPPKLSASSLGFDEVYMINLKRRPDRLTKMDHVLEILGIDYTLIEAVDGQYVILLQCNAMSISIYMLWLYIQGIDT